MSKQQQRQLDANLRRGQFDTGADVQTLRAAFSELMAQVPVAPDVQQNPVEVGGVAPPLRPTPSRSSLHHVTQADMWN